MSRSIQVDDVRDDAASIDYCDPHWMPLSEAVQRSLRTSWWRARRRGNDLPAKCGLIVIEGGAA